jgi:hypothetical protein
MEVQVNGGHTQIMELIYWGLGAAGAIAAAFLGIWWRVESNQDKRVKDLAQQNSHQHDQLHGKIDKVRDKVEEIWKHLVKND